MWISEFLSGQRGRRPESAAINFLALTLTSSRYLVLCLRDGDRPLEHVPTDLRQIDGQWRFIRQGALRLVGPPRYPGQMAQMVGMGASRRCGLMS